MKTTATFLCVCVCMMAKIMPGLGLWLVLYYLLV